MTSYQSVGQDHPRFKELSGRVFGKYTAIRYSHSHTKPSGRKVNFWLCRCECGEEREVRVDTLTSGATKSCGCSRAEYVSVGNIKHGNRSKLIHGKVRVRLFGIWEGMIDRCTNPKGKFFDNYGGRGIAVCERWMDFENFYSDMFPSYQEGLSVDRVNNDGPYSPENCRWATDHQQSRNKRNTKWVSFMGRTQCLADWCIELGVPYTNARYRLSRGHPPEIIFSKKSISKWTASP